MFTTLLVDPIYNAFIFLLGLVPGNDVGLAIIALTLIVRAVFYPVFASSIRTSMAMQVVRPQLDDINEHYKDDVEERSRKTMELFRAHRINPFSSILSALLQVVVFIALYWALFRTGLPEIDTARLYSWVHAPALFGTDFFGLIDLFSHHNVLVALIVLVLQYLVMRFSIERLSGNLSPKATDAQKMAHRMQNAMMLYFLPLLIGYVAYAVPAAVGVYFITGNLISLGQEWLIRRRPL